MIKPTRLYLLTHTPTHMGRPVQMGFLGKNTWSDGLFETYKEGVQANLEAGVSYAYLSKKDIERWGFMPPVGARVQVLEVEIPRQEFLEAWNLVGGEKEMK